MIKYEYLVVASDQAEATNHVQTTFTQYGADGWELKSVSPKFFIFSREARPLLVGYNNVSGDPTVDITNDQQVSDTMRQLGED